MKYVQSTKKNKLANNMLIAKSKIKLLHFFNCSKHYRNRKKPLTVC